MDDSLNGSFLPEEMEFFAGDTTIMILPKFSLPSSTGSMLRSLTGEFGPFQPNIPVEVPLWLAITLHKRKKCRIQPPEWMQPDNLQEVYEKERDNAAVFQELPFHFIEVAHLLLRHARDSFDDLYRVRDMVEMVRKVRSTKIDAGLKVLRGPMTVKLNNLSAMECNVIRPFFQGALDRFYKVGLLEEGLAPASQTQPSY